MAKNYSVRNVSKLKVYLQQVKTNDNNTGKKNIK
ncbi:hypothetical protein UFOVP384_11 [uncultured Caudovirales phage]|uniref:Uncharacterized protein n=1 Tax=uncultured Caudovirales phage TaxID=2100421 RepID=A0A6J7X269_9CAUD|nr:hypothetical protein UFOVP384_11 [uncultured Caudovirales phage]